MDHVKENHKMCVWVLSTVGQYDHLHFIEFIKHCSIGDEYIRAGVNHQVRIRKGMLCYVNVILYVSS